MTFIIKECILYFASCFTIYNPILYCRSGFNLVRQSPHLSSKSRNTKFPFKTTLHNLLQILGHLAFAWPPCNLEAAAHSIKIKSYLLGLAGNILTCWWYNYKGGFINVRRPLIPDYVYRQQRLCSLGAK